MSGQGRQRRSALSILLGELLGGPVVELHAQLASDRHFGGRDGQPPLAQVVTGANEPLADCLMHPSEGFLGPPGVHRRYLTTRGQIDASRSYLESAAAFPTNVNVEATLTVNAQAQPRSFIPGLPPNNPPPGTPTSSRSFVVHYSMVKLPASVPGEKYMSTTR